MRSDFIIHLNFTPSSSSSTFFSFLNAKFCHLQREKKLLNEVCHLAYSELASEQLPWDHEARCEEPLG